MEWQRASLPERGELMSVLQLTQGVVVEVVQGILMSAATSPWLQERDIDLSNLQQGGIPEADWSYIVTLP